MPGLQGLDGLTTAHQMSKVIVNDTTRTRINGRMQWSLNEIEPVLMQAIRYQVWFDHPSQHSE